MLLQHQSPFSSPFEHILEICFFIRFLFVSSQYKTTATDQLTNGLDKQIISTDTDHKYLYHENCENRLKNSKMKGEFYAILK